MNTPFNLVDEYIRNAVATRSRLVARQGGYTEGWRQRLRRKIALDVIKIKLKRKLFRHRHLYRLAKWVCKKYFN